MRDLHHDNVVEFVGACVEAPHVCIVTEYCARGSLKVSATVYSTAAVCSAF